MKRKTIEKMKKTYDLTPQKIVRFFLPNTKIFNKFNSNFTYITVIYTHITEF